ncbi:MAG: hypothetical protein K2X82_05780 [Gemmataceae bacterium]|nr:hypothetical protein [Gemmataceae bacterium]
MTGKTRAARFLELGPDGWTTYPPGTAYRFPFYLTVEGGQTVAVAATLSGVAGRGANPDEAVDAIRRAAAALIRERKQAGLRIPWTEPTPPPPGGLTRWVLVRLTDPA